MTDETKHTPGPWWVGDVDDFDGIAILYDEERVPVANVPEGYSDRNAQANADLIAAAPDLLAALKPFAEHPNDWTVDTVGAAIAAIVKAEGRKK